MDHNNKQPQEFDLEDQRFNANVLQFNQEMEYQAYVNNL